MKTGLTFKALSIFRRCADSQSSAQELIFWLTFSFSFLAIGGPELHAQLAITEVMSSASRNCAVPTNAHPDFWELTNYGTEPIDLTKFRFWDDEDIQIPDTVLPEGTSIGPMESIVFVRSHTTLLDEAAFRQWWWGTATGGPPFQIVFYGYSPGLDYAGEPLFLWDAGSNLVDRMEYPEVLELSGITLTADPLGGTILVPSEINVSGAFRSATCADVGSPGLAPNPVPLAIDEHPRDMGVDAGNLVRLHVRARGLPRPMLYEWYHNRTFIGGSGRASTNLPLLINFAGSGLAWEALKETGDLELGNVQPSQAGEYFVVVGNGLQTRTSAVARITVNTNAAAPRIEAPPGVRWFPTLDGSRETNLVVSPSQRAVFGLSARAYPSPTFQWSHSANGLIFVDLPGETNQLLTIENVEEADVGIYRVEVENLHGKAYAYARLTLAPPPQLRITEAMPDPCELSRHDWWELTNIGIEPVNLAGYRWDDAPGNIGGGPTITNAVVIEPGESIIFLESQTPESFRAWWGEQNLPKDLKLIVYNANGLTEMPSDYLSLWNPSAVLQDDRIHNVEFSRALKGVTYWFDVPACSGFHFGVLSTNDVCGAFTASNQCDLGSPGWTRWTPPAFANIHRTPSGMRLQWKAQAGSANIVQYASSPTGGETGWSTLGTFTFSTVSGTTTDPTLGPAQQRFYRILRVAEAECPCPEDYENLLSNTHAPGR